MCIALLHVGVATVTKTDLNACYSSEGVDHKQHV
jgi:hypothetical protein